MPQETDARLIVDRLLREAGWDIEDKAQVSTEESAAGGRADYVLKDSRSRPLAAIEAKRFSVDPYSAGFSSHHVIGHRFTGAPLARRSQT